jgi:6-phosphogluconate dehydrogenase
MQLGFVGLGRMGLNMVTRLARAGHKVVAYDRSPEAVTRAATAGAEGAASLEALVSTLVAPRAIWLMVPAGDATESTVNALAPLLLAGDIVIDGGNSNFHDDVRRAQSLAAKGIRYVDAGTSGGVWGLEEGYCLMVGGDVEVCRHLEPIFLTLAPKGGYLRVGDHGAGHFVKMIHNGIEYGLMQAYAEGFDILRHAGDETLPADQRYDFDLADIAELWRRGSVVASWLLDLTAIALAEDPRLDGYSGFVQDSGEGRWTLLAAIEEAVPADVLSASLYARFRSRQDHTFAEKLLSAMRKQFGGHVEPK